MNLKVIGGAILAMSTAFAETPAEAHKKLAETYFKGDGHALVYQLSKKDLPKGPQVVANVAEGRKQSAFFLRLPDGGIMSGLGHYSTGVGEKESTLISKGQNYIGISLGQDMQVILDHLSPNQEKVTAYFNPQALLTTQNIDLGAGYAVGGEKPYPWGSEILENIERVERKDDSVIFHGKDNETIKFEESSGLLLEHRMPALNNRKMTLISRKEMKEFNKTKHGLPGKPGQTDDLVEMARVSFQAVHKLTTLIGAGRLLRLPEDRREEALENFQTALNAHYRKIGRLQPYLSDPMGVKVVLKASVNRSLNEQLKLAEDAGKDPIPILKRERGRCIDSVTRMAPQLAKMLAKKNIYGLRPEKIDPKERSALEKLIHAQKVAILRNLTCQIAEKEIDERIGEN
ncbi:MAG: hypothetical protein ABF380_13180 [Akkermansiaceae bacterium]